MQTNEEEQLLLAANGVTHSIITLKTMYSDYGQYILLTQTKFCTIVSKPKWELTGQSISR